MQCLSLNNIHPASDQMHPSSMVRDFSSSFITQLSCTSLIVAFCPALCPASLSCLLSLLYSYVCRACVCVFCHSIIELIGALLSKSLLVSRPSLLKFSFIISLFVLSSFHSPLILSQSVNPFSQRNVTNSSFSCRLPSCRSLSLPPFLSSFLPSLPPFYALVADFFFCFFFCCFF